MIFFKARARIEQYEKRLVQAQQENDHYKQTLDEVKVHMNVYAFLILCANLFKSFPIFSKDFCFTVRNLGRSC